MTVVEVREEIRRIDSEIIGLIKQRQNCAEKMAKAKMAEGMTTVDPKQREVVLNRIEASAKEAGIDPEKAKQIYKILIEMSEERQNEVRLNDMKI